MLTRTLWPAVAIVIVAAPATAAAPTADELIDKATKAMGGDAIKKIDSYRASSEVSSPMGTMTSVVYWAKPAHVLVKRTIPNVGEMEMGTDGKIGWSKNPMMGYSLLTGDEIDPVAQQAMHMRLFNLHDTLMEDYDDVEVAGKGDFGGAPCWELRLTSKKDGAAGSMFFDEKTGFIRGMRMTKKGADGDESATMRLTDWKPIAKVNFFHGIEVDDGETATSVRYTEIEVNKVDPKVFAVPDEVKDFAKQPEGGEMSIDDFSPQVQQMIRGMLDSLPDDPNALRGMRAQLEQQAARMPGEYKKGMEYVISRIDKKLKAPGG